MGEIADMMINGLMCEQCGVYMDDGEEPGYARLCAGCGEDQKVMQRDMETEIYRRCDEEDAKGE